jgi:NhaP-type Na+/H+ or K+/H+ antiporter
VFVLCFLARLVTVPLQLAVLNLCRRKENRFTMPQAVVMIHAGLRGAIAYALCLQFPVLSFQQVVRCCWCWCCCRCVLLLLMRMWAVCRGGRVCTVACGGGGAGRTGEGAAAVVVGR